jgi:Hydantoinase B/oxoprolinase
VELLSNALAAFADEMGITHVRASYSSIVRDMLDLSTAVTYARGRRVAQGLSPALQLGPIPRFIAKVDPGDRDVYFGPRDDSLAVSVIARGHLKDRQGTGPAAIEEFDATIVVPPGTIGSRHGTGSVLLTWPDAADRRT